MGKGLSPRGRGKLARLGRAVAYQGSIPAWAGETNGSGYTTGNPPVYPRVGGGNRNISVKRFISQGLSPRGRGKLHADRLVHPLAGSIPAWAGETRTTRGARSWETVYPRVGGGNLLRSWSIVLRRGLSPRGRGKPLTPVILRDISRSIPAWAEETQTDRLAAVDAEVYPRVGGGNALYSDFEQSPKGLSPRGRGKLSISSLDATDVRSIPAWAGETCPRALDSYNRSVYPRVGGGNRERLAPSLSLSGLSPRGRGKQTEVRSPTATFGSIPAWAGETDGSTLADGYLWVYPRVGGGNAFHYLIDLIYLGLSPRGRGKRPKVFLNADAKRSIPAWAGETAEAARAFA